jgi:hypothetical protein
MEWQSIRGHALVLISTLAGIVGMGVVFGGAMHGNLSTMMQGAPFLLLGLWWAGRELGRSMMLSRVPSSRGDHPARPHKRWPRS